jgi:transposase
MSKKTATNAAGDPLRFQRIERYQYEFRDLCLDELVSQTHEVRSVWQYVCGLDLSEFHREYDGKSGRIPVDPRILLTLWLYAIIEGISSSRHLAKRCKRDAIYMWICGGVGVNHNLLSAFRVNHRDALLELLSQTIAVLQHHELIKFDRISQDGVRVRAHAGKSSFRKIDTLESLFESAKEKVESVFGDIDDSDDDDDPCSPSQQAARLRAAEDRERRLKEALAEHADLSKRREKRKKGDGATTRVSTTDPESRNMKMADGGYRPAYNIQAATLNDSRLIVDVHAINEGTDSNQVEPMLDRVESQFGERPKEVLVDGGYNSREDVTAVESSGTKIFMPVRASRNSAQDRYAFRRGDSEEVKNWRERMSKPDSQEIYQERSSTAEFPFARFRNHGLQQLPVRGLAKAEVIGVWHALVHNFRQIRHLGWMHVLAAS